METYLPKPPKLSGSNYPWRELDNYLYKIYKMLGMPTSASDTASYNVIQQLSNNHNNLTEIQYTNYESESVTKNLTDDILIQVLSDRTENPTFENRISALEDDIGEMMEQLDTVITKLDSLTEQNELMGDILVELRVLTSLMNEGLNTKENLNTLRQDEESERLQ